VEHRTCDHDHRELGEVARDLDGLDPCGSIVPAGHHPLRLAHHQVAEPGDMTLLTGAAVRASAKGTATASGDRYEPRGAAADGRCAGSERARAATASLLHLYDAPDPAGRLQR